MKQTRKQEIYDHVAALRKWMKENEIDAFIVPSSDPHDGEYTPSHWHCRQWLTGFEGSAGTAVVTRKTAALWTDSRYFIAAAEDLKGTPFTLMREGEPGVPSIVEWLAKEAEEVCLPSDLDSSIEEQNYLVGYPAEMVSVPMARSWEKVAEGVYSMAREYHEEEYGFVFMPCDDPFDEIWYDRPGLPLNKLSVYPEEYAGMTPIEKIAALKSGFHTHEGTAQALVLTDLSEIAWTLNLRGTDVEYNPLFLSFLIVSNKRVTLFVDPNKLTNEVQDHLKKYRITTARYSDFYPALEDLCEKIKEEPDEDNGWNVLLTEGANIRVRDTIKGCNVNCIVLPSVVAPMRAMKTDAEIEGMRRSMLRDGVALVKMHRWLDETIAAGIPVTEISLDEKLTALRAEDEAFRGLSFATIAGYAVHSAIVHYEATPDTDVTLQPRKMLLLDTGAQYIDGTTDITRTIPLGSDSDLMHKLYTLVLKGHIALALAVFPAGTTGLQLDILARQFMWRAGYDFGHGTGHGVGSYLCVHEGPAQVRKDLRACTTQPIRARQTMTDEPGIYLEGIGGVRIENVLLAVHHEDTPWGEQLRFEVLTLCPIDREPIVLEMLTPEERAWIDSYHQRVREALLPLLSDEADKAWLLRATAPL